MKHLIDIVAINEDELRRKTEKIGHDINRPSPSVYLASRDSREGENLQGMGASPTDQLAGEQTTQKGAPDNASPYRSEPSDYTELGNHAKPLPFDGLIESAEDRRMAEDVLESIERESESDEHVLPPPDSGIRPKDSTPPGPSQHDRSDRV